MKSRWAQRLALIGASAMCPALAAAHGGEAEIVRVAAVDAQGAPWLLQLSEGLGVRRDGVWTFVCPAQLEAASVLDAVSADGASAWAVTLRGVWRIAADGVPERVGEPCGDTPIQLVAHQGTVYLHARDSARGAQVVCALEASGAREVYASEVAVADVASDGAQLWLARTAAAGFELEAVGGEHRAYPDTGVHRALQLTAAGGVLYAHLIDFQRTTLVRASPQRAETLLEATRAVSGPVESSGVLLAIVDGSLVALEGGEAPQLESRVGVEGLDSLGGRSFAFADGTLYALPTLQWLFSLDELQAPAHGASAECSLQWRRFQRALHGVDHAIDAGALDAADAGESADAGSESIAAGGGCSVAGARPSGWLALWGALVLAGFRRARRRARAALRRLRSR